MNCLFRLCWVWLFKSKLLLPVVFIFLLIACNLFWFGLDLAVSSVWIMAEVKLCLSSSAHKTFPLMMVAPLVVDNCPLPLALNTVPYAIVYYDLVQMLLMLIHLKLFQMLLILLQYKLFQMLLVLLQIEAIPDAVSAATNRNCSRCC